MALNVHPKVKASAKAATYSGFVLAVLTSLATHYHLLASVPADYQAFVLGTAAAVVVGAVTWVAGYMSKHLPIELVQDLEDAYDAAKNPAKNPPAA